MKKEHMESHSRCGTADKRATDLLKQRLKKISDIDLDRSVMHRMVLSAAMALPAIVVCMILTILRLGVFWHYFLLTMLLIFTILVFVEVYRLGNEIRKHGRQHENLQ
jgi:hypothetical protein